ncbi:hypothetical protein PGH24_04040 [Thermoanaerobacterium thermosaccharolyticum]|uniref:hypothetical protein n=1 Tax=Thermoanaerobacterium thermosaccharolyticum TaxID=1517 RepID=UPI00279F81E1|nr:hypothetical protein [Thermoanaerobacterium sp.]WHE07928.1 hypothetical protein PGH24_04040 [Thermoanaerobacterium thermosaccharolyticum]
MILLAELAAWIVRAALISWCFSGVEVFALLTPLEQGYLHTNFSRYLLFFIASLFINILASGLPELKPVKMHQFCKKVEYYFTDTWTTLNFLLQGSKNQKIKRNIIVLSGLKKICIPIDMSHLFIENTEPIKKVEYIKTIIIMIISLVLMIIAPIGIMKLYDYIATVLILLGMPEKFAGHIIFDTSIILFYFYFIGPYVFSTLDYKNSSAIIFSKQILNDGNYAVYESPIMPFLQGCPLGMAHKGKIFVNSLISKNQNILSYVIAHEEGHIEDHYNNIMRNFFSPVIFPWIVYISVLIIDYLHFVGKLHYTYWKLIIVAVSVICLILIIFIQIEQKCQQRADEFAIRKIGIDNAIKALQELAYGDIMLPEKYKYRYRSQAIKLIERLKQK